MNSNTGSELVGGVSKLLTTFLAIAGSVIGMCVGGITTWITLSDRMEKKVELRVTERMTMSNDIVRLEQQISNLKSDVKILREEWLYSRRVAAAPATTTVIETATATNPQPIK